MPDTIPNPVTEASVALREAGVLARRLLADPQPFADLPADVAPRVVGFARRVADEAPAAVAALEHIGAVFMPQARPPQYDRTSATLRDVVAAGNQLADYFDTVAGSEYGRGWTFKPPTEAERAAHAEVRAHVAGELASGRLARHTLAARLVENARAHGHSPYLTALWTDVADGGRTRFFDEATEDAIRAALVEHAGLAERVAGLRRASARVRWLQARVEAAAKALAAGDGDAREAEPMRLWRNA